MKKWGLSFLAVIPFLLWGNYARPDATEGEWLMMVVSNITDPKREGEFNYWYDKIDIPDVLKVPGFMRARRGVSVEVDGALKTALHDPSGKYLALYNIDSPDIDKTIIDMLLASWNMEKNKRSIELIDVTERVYYRRRVIDIDNTQVQLNAGGQKSYLLLVKIDCCKDMPSTEDFNRWYIDQYLPKLENMKGLIKATRYDLHRVVMIEEKYTPKIMIVLEMDGASDADVINNFAENIADFGDSSGIDSFQKTIMYRKVNDALRN